MIILYEVIGIYGGGKIMLKLVVEGFGVIVGGVVCNVMEFVGVNDVILKWLGFNMLINVVCVIFEGFKVLKSVEEVFKLCGIFVDYLVE